jgi:hypothetical protein
VRLTGTLSGSLAESATAVDRPALAVLESLAAVLPDGLVRGRSVLCSGDAALSLALAIVAGASRSGSWLAVFGLGDLGLLAAHEQGIALERTVLVAPPSPASVSSAGTWSAALGAAVEGFELLLVEVSSRIPAGEARKLQQRVLARRAVLVLVDVDGRHARQPVFQPDVVLHTVTTRWCGIGHGHGHVREREVMVEVSGRRVPATQHAARCVTLPAPH